MAANVSPDYPMWSALLRWSLKQQDGTSREAPSAMSAEDRAFLEAALKDATVDEGQRLGEVLQLVASEDESSEAALRELEETVERLDLARDICKMGGMKVVLAAAARGSVAACGVVATAAQNDAPAQEAIAADGGLTTLVAAFQKFGDDEDFRRSALSATSALVRGNADLEKQFLQLGTGGYLLASALNGGSPRLAAKAAFFLYALLYEAEPARVEDLEPALRALLPRATEPLPSSSSEDNHTAIWQLRESATNAIVRASKANSSWVKRNLGVPIQQAAKHIRATASSSDADHDAHRLADLIALWRDIDWLDDDLSSV